MRNGAGTLRCLPFADRLNLVPRAAIQMTRIGNIDVTRGRLLVFRSRPHYCCIQTDSRSKIYKLNAGHPERIDLENRIRILSAGVDDLRARMDQLAADGKSPQSEHRRMLVHERLGWVHRKHADRLEMAERRLRTLPA
jgi:hypothetical protein